MNEGTGTAPRLGGRFESGIVERAASGTRGLPPDERVKVGLEKAVGFAEAHPDEASTILGDLRVDHEARRRLEEWLGDGTPRTTFGLGAAIELARSELDSPSPDLRAREPELRRWLEGDW